MQKNTMKSNYYTIIFGVVWAFCWNALAKDEPSFQLKVILNTSGVSRELKSWGSSELLHFKQTKTREKDPQSQKVTQLKGVLLSALIEKALEALPPESRAQIDLIILNGQNGQQAMVPRALIIKYPLVIAIHSETGENPLSVVVPWTSRPRIQEENLPLESYFVRNLTQVQLTNYQNHFSYLSLKRRTDPSAMRGERLFVQNCAECHHSQQGQTPLVISSVNQVKQFTDKGHPGGAIQIKLIERDKKSIMRYADALQLEYQESSSKIVKSTF